MLGIETELENEILVTYFYIFYEYFIKIHISEIFINDKFLLYLQLITFIVFK